MGEEFWIIFIRIYSVMITIETIINILRIVKLKIKNEKLEKENQRLRSLLNLNENTIL
nr:MAG TPA: alpha/beta peptide [Caudoviricetes sp.]